jgi:HSP20 family protein
MSWDDWFRRKRRFPFFDIESFPFGFYTGDLEEMMKELERKMDEAFKEMGEKIPSGLVRERRLPDGSTTREMGPFVYGYSVTIGPDKKPVIREFGNIKPSPARPGLDVKEVREPLVDVISTNGEIKVIAEIPGVDKHDIKLHATEKNLTISVYTPERKYHREIELPSEVDIDGAKSSYRNGVLEVTFPKLREKRPKGTSIKIE